MTPSHFSLILFAALANLVLGAIILHKQPAGHIHRSFAAFSFSVALWTLSNGLVSAYPGTTWGYVWGRLTFASASIIPFAFLLFVSVFPTAQLPAPKFVVRTFAISALAFFSLSFSPLILRSTASVDGQLHVTYGPLHLVFGIYFVSCLGFSLFLLTRKVVVSTGLQKLQVRYLFAGVLVAAVGAIVANLLIPLFLQNSQFSRYGPLFGMLMVATIGHAVIRHRLLDIKVVIKKGVVYVCTLLAVTCLFLLLAEVLKRLGAYHRHSISIVEALLVALFLAIFFQPLKTLIQTSLNRYLYRETYDFQRILRDASHRLSAILDLDPLLDYLVQVIESTFRAENVTVFLRKPTSDVFTCVLPRTGAAHPRALSNTSPLVHFLRTHRSSIVREEASRHTDSLVHVSVSQSLAELGSDLAFPLAENHILIGVVTIGPKRSGDPYFADDIALLDTLISQAAITVTNATLYRQVVLANEYVDNILSTMDSGVVAVNAMGDIALFNAAAQTLTGLPVESVRGCSYHNLPSQLASPLQDTLERSSSRFQFETAIVQPDGSLVPVVCSTAILRQDDQSIHGALIVFSDTTRIKELEQEKRRVERLASFGALASGVAHEIKNPLVAIRTFAELLPERYGDIDFREDFSKVVVREIARIDDLVGRLRGLAATAPKQAGAVDIREPIRDTLILLRAQLEQARIHVIYDCPDSPLHVAVHDAQLKQLLLNLLLNSVEAIGRDGELRIRVAKRENQGHLWVLLEVSDTGPGIPEPLLASIFEPFFTTKPRGSGLGLAICRGITDAHHGTIRAFNGSGGVGTTMSVELPAATGSAIVHEEPALRH